MQSWFRQGLTPIYDTTPLLESADPILAHQTTSGALTPHELVWRKGPVDSVLRSARLGSMTFIVLRYGAAVHIAPNELKHFMLFQVPIQGAAHIQTGKGAVDANPTTGAIISPTLSMQLDWSEGCEQFLLKIPRARIEECCRNLLGAEFSKAVEFSPCISLETPQGQAWQHQIAAMLACLNQPTYAAHPRWIAALEEALIHHLLLTQPNNYSERLAHRPGSVAPRHVRAADDFIRANLQEPLTLAEIAAAAGSSVRSLSDAFQEHYQQSPIAYVRQCRLEAVHEELRKADPGVRVTDIALRWGFNHLGRFSALYRERFGEAPLETLRR